MKKFLIAIWAICACSCTPEVQQVNSDQAFEELIENFSSPGSRRGNRYANDLGTEYYRTQIDGIRQQLDDLSLIDTSQLSFKNRVDWRFAQSILRGQEIRQAEHQSWKKDPRNYMLFRGFVGVLGGPQELSNKINEIQKRLIMLPKQLQNGQNQIDTYIPRFQELGLFMAENAVTLFLKELPEFVANNSEAEALTPLIKVCQESLGNFISFLKDDLPLLPQGEFSMGKEIYNAILQEEFLLDYNDETLWEFGNLKFDETVSELEVLAKEIDPAKTWQELAIEIKNDYPDPYKMIEVHQLWMDSSKAHVLANNLIPIPWKERIIVEPRAEYLRKTSYYGNFSFAKGKDSDSIFTSRVMINPFEDQWDEKTKQEFLVEHDWGVIRVTAPHETYAGHHVQGLYQLHNPRKIRRENGISVFSEGWGLYNEQLMRETGFFPEKRIQLRQLQLRLWRNARVLYDVGMHSGRMSYEDAIDLMTNRVGFLRWASQLEVDASAARPGYFIGYFIGMTEILKMRELYKAKVGDQFTLSDFHERLLKIGNMPPKLMRESLFEN